MINSWVWKRYVWLPLIIIGFIIGFFSSTGILIYIFNNKQLGSFKFLIDYRFQLFATIYCCCVLSWKLWYSSALELIVNKIPGPYFFYTSGITISIFCGIYNMIVFNDIGNMLFLLVPLISSMITSIFFYTMYSFNYYTYSKFNKYVKNKNKVYKIFREGIEIKAKAKNILKGDIILIKPGDYIPVSCKFTMVNKNINFSFFDNDKKVYQLSSDDTLIRGLKSLHEDILWLETLRDYKDNKDLKPHFMKFENISNIKKDKLSSIIIYIYTFLTCAISIIVLFVYKFNLNKLWVDSLATYTSVLIIGSPIYYIYISSMCKSFAIFNSIKLGCFSFKKDPFHNMTYLKKIYINREDTTLSKDLKINNYFGKQENMNIYSEIIKNDFGRFYEIFVESFDFNIDTSKLKVDYRENKSISVEGNHYEVLGIESVNDHKLNQFCTKYKSSITGYLPCLIFTKNNNIEFICELEDFISDNNVTALEKINRKKIKTTVFSYENQAVISRTIHGVKIDSIYSNSRPSMFSDLFVKDKNSNTLSVSNDIDSMNFYNSYTKYNIAGLKTYEYGRDNNKGKNDCYAIDISISNIYKIITTFITSSKLRYLFLFLTLLFSLSGVLILVLFPYLTIPVLYFLGFIQFVIVLSSKNMYISKK